jgi:hypothetical protein
MQTDGRDFTVINADIAEGYFSFMKARYRDHRGLSPLKRKAFFNWFFYLKP